jgi:hypothetical protein
MVSKVTRRLLHCEKQTLNYSYFDSVTIIMKMCYCLPHSPREVISFVNMM